MSGGGQAALCYEDSSEMSSPRRALYAPLRRSLSEQLRDSSARAWDLLWRNVRERRLAGRCPGPRVRVQTSQIGTVPDS